VGTLKGVGRVYQQTFVDTYSKVVAAKLYTTTTPITSADMLNDKVLPLFEENGMGLLRILTDRGTEYCGRPEYHDYQLYLAVNDIEHTKTKERSPKTNGICERFHRTMLNQFYQVAFRKKIYESIDALQKDVDVWIEHYNNEPTHQGKMCCGRTQMQTFIEVKNIWMINVENLNLIGQ
jgi:transposase InsO family protein